MGMAAKVLWGEGLFLRPQHFQRQDQYHEARLHHTASALHPYLWGVAQLQWDLAALKTGTLRLQALSAIFRDGEVFEALGDGAPGSDTLPPPVDLEALPPAVQEVTYYAALPILNREGMNYTAQASKTGTPAATRFAHAMRATPDLFTESTVADVAYLKKTVRLIPDSEARGSYDCLPLIALRRTVSGGFEPVPSFMAPSLAIAGAPRLQGVLEHLLDALQAKVSALHGHHREPSRNVIEFRSGDVSSFWLLHTVSTAAAALMHYVRHPALHPERLYEALLGLAGGLLSYSRHYTLASLPAYDHAQPGACFDAIDAHHPRTARHRHLVEVFFHRPAGGQAVVLPGQARFGQDRPAHHLVPGDSRRHARHRTGGRGAAARQSGRARRRGKMRAHGHARPETVACAASAGRHSRAPRNLLFCD